ncbi:hypothetical protein HB802_13805 [Listeria welshimeri]|nr:hypothetical protein [Listeria welshimeri]
MRDIKKKWIKSTFLLVILILTIIIPMSKENKVYAEEKTEKTVQAGKSNSAYTLFSQILMGNEEIQENAEGKSGFSKILHPIESAKGGSVSIDIPYTEISTSADKILQGNVSATAKASEGRRLASFLATMSAYGYIDVQSSFSIINAASSAITELGRLIGGIILVILNAIYLGMTFVIDGIFGFLREFNIFISFGLADAPSDGGVASKITESFGGFIEDAFGINKESFKLGSRLIILISSIIFAVSVIINLNKKSPSISKAFAKPLSKLALRIGIVSGIVLIGICFNAVTNLVDEALGSNKKMSGESNSIIQESFLDVHGWAITQNLAIPSGVNPPDENYRNNKYVDESFEPSAMKSSDKFVKKVNENTNMIINKTSDGGKDTSSAVRDFEILADWMMVTTFNVNDYTGEVRGFSDVKEGNGTSYVAAFNNGGDVFKNNAGEAFNPKIISGYIWTTDQAVNEDNQIPTGFGVAPQTLNKDTKTVEVDFDAAKKWGMKTPQTFNTQSVALLLQSDFTPSSAQFYAINLPASGMQEMKKTMGTTKTAWFSVMLPGGGILGGIGSYIGIVAKIIASVIVISGFVFAVLASAFFQATLISVKKLFFEGFIGTKLGATVHALLLAIATLVLGAMGYFLINGSITFIENLSGAIFNLMNINIPVAGVTSIIQGIVLIALSIWFALPFKRDSNKIPVVYLVNLPYDLASDIGKKVENKLDIRPSTNFNSSRNSLGTDMENNNSKFDKKGSNDAKRNNLQPSSQNASNSNNGKTSQTNKNNHGNTDNNTSSKQDGFKNNHNKSNKQDSEDSQNSQNIPNNQLGNVFGMDESKYDQLNNNEVDSYGDGVDSAEDNNGTDDVDNEELFFDNYNSTINTSEGLREAVRKKGNDNEMFTDNEWNKIYSSPNLSTFNENLKTSQKGLEASLQMDDAQTLLKEGGFGEKDENGNNKVDSIVALQLAKANPSELNAEELEKRKNVLKAVELGKKELYYRIESGKLSQLRDQQIGKLKKIEEQKTMSNLSSKAKNINSQANNFARKYGRKGSITDLATTASNKVADIVDSNVGKLEQKQKVLRRKNIEKDITGIDLKQNNIQKQRREKMKKELERIKNKK